MNLRLLLASAVLVTTASPVPAQIVDTAAGHPSGEILDSLQAGRKRWTRAHVVEYQVQSHVDCFCIYHAEDIDRQLRGVSLTVCNWIRCMDSPSGTRHTILQYQMTGCSYV
jgi:hypothetical protein